MKNERKTNELYDAFGMIDDDIITEAENLASSRYKRRSARSRRLTAALSAAAVIVLTVVPLSMFFGRNTGNGESNAPTQNLDDVMTQVKDAVASGNAEGITVYEDSGIDFFDGQCKIIWQYVGEETLYSVNAQGGEKVVSAKLSFPVTKVYSPSEDSPYRVWISYGDGTVKSPYLLDSLGNTGFGTLFDYMPEVEPSERFLDYFGELIGEKM